MDKKLHELSIDEAKEGLKRKDYSSVEVTQACLTRSQGLNPKLNAFITFNSEALELAKRADVLIATQPDIFEKKPLLGIPYALKDNFATVGLKTTASSKVLEGFVPPYESTVSQRLADAGAIVLGKTNMDAWAHGSSTETSDWGPTKNPWNEKHTPGGSSGGSAAAMAANMAIFSIGSETAGSVRQPASWCGVTGLKPSYGRCSRFGVVAMASSTDSPGPIAKNTKDCKTVLEVIAGKDPLDATTIPDPEWRMPADIKRHIKIGVIKDYFLKDAQPEVNETVLTAVEALKKAYSKELEFSDISLIDPKYAIAVYTILMRSEVSSNLARYDGVRYGNPRKAFGDEAKRRMMFGAYSLSSGYYDAYYKKALQARTAIVNDFAKAFSKVDVLIAPTSPCTATKLGESENQAMFGEMQDVLVEASSIAGLPGINLPCGFVDGLPVGMQFIGKFKDEGTLVHLGNKYQQISDWHRKKPNI